MCVCSPCATFSPWWDMFLQDVFVISFFLQKSSDEVHTYWYRSLGHTCDTIIYHSFDLIQQIFMQQNISCSTIPVIKVWRFVLLVFKYFFVFLISNDLQLIILGYKCHKIFFWTHDLGTNCLAHRSRMPYHFTYFPFLQLMTSQWYAWMTYFHGNPIVNIYWF